MSRLLRITSCLLLVLAVSPVRAAGVARVSSGWLGVSLTPNKTVAQVFRGTPAFRGGLRVGDSIQSVDGTAAKDTRHLIELIKQSGAHSEISLSVLRLPKVLTLKVTLSPVPTDEQRVRDHMVGHKVPREINSLIAIGPGSLGARAPVRVIELWATWCAPCLASMPQLSKWQSRYSKHGLQVINVSGEDSTVLARFVQNNRYKQTIAHDPGQRLSRAVGSNKTPTTLIVDAKGIVRFVKIGVADFDELEKAFVPLLQKP